MIDKNAILQAISQALDAMGVSGGGDDEFNEDQSVSGPNNVPIWSQLDVSVPDEGRGPIHSKSALFGPVGNYRDTQPMATNMYGMPQDDDSAEMMTAMGMV